MLLPLIDELSNMYDMYIVLEMEQENTLPIKLR